MKHFFSSTSNWTQCFQHLSIKTALRDTNLPPACAEPQRATFLFPESFMLVAPPEACQGLYIRHLQRGSLRPSHVTGEHTEVMDSDRARTHFTHDSPLRPNTTGRVSLMSPRKSSCRGRDAARISISLVVDGWCETDKLSYWRESHLYSGRFFYLTLRKGWNV